MAHALPDVNSILAEATKIVYGDRRAAYGTPAENHGRTAALWSAYLGVPINARQVCMLNVLQKIGRDAHAPGRDNLVDIAGYAENAHLCEPLPPTPTPTPQAGLVPLVHPFDRRCAEHVHGWSCSLLEGHEGRHIAYRDHDVNNLSGELARWDR